MSRSAWRVRFRRCARALGLAVVLAAGLVGRAAADVHPNTESGVAVDRAFQSEEVDNINLFNGNLTVTIPLGNAYPVNGALSYRFTLVYNSNPWTYASRTLSDGKTTYTHSMPSPCSNAGLGWRESFGGIGPSTCNSTDNTVTSATETYEAPDGSQHLFYSSLHPGETPTSGYLYTRDGSYLRLHRLPPTLDSEIEFPDGTIHHFNSVGQITQIRDRFGTVGNNVSFFYFADTKICSGAPTCWQIHDSQNRDHWVYFRAEGIDHLDLAAFGGQRAIYTFNYATTMTARSCLSNDSTFGDLNVSFLTNVVLPDGSSYAPGLGGYGIALAGKGGCAFASGSLTGLTLPTLARISWGYQTYFFPTPGRRASNPGIATRTATDAAGNRIGQWTYTTTPTIEPGGASIELVNAVNDPAGNVTKRYFSTGPTGAGGIYGPGSNVYDYARQYTPKTQLGTTGLYLSEQVFDSGGTLRRTEWVRYERDLIDSLVTQLPDASNNNGRLAQQTTVYDDGTQAGSIDQDFDGVGHYRFRQTSGTFAGNNIRSERQQWNPARGSYAVDQSSNTVLGVYHAVTTSEPWVLVTRQFDRTQDSGGASEFRSYCYDTATGFLQRQRTYVQSTTNPGTLSSNDLIEVFGNDGHGNVTSESSYGGDLSPVAPTSSDLCQQALPASPEYQVVHNYTFGVLQSSKYTGLSFFSLDRDIDASTGSVKVSRDPAGVPTTYTYDALGRMIQLQPRDSAATVYTYNRATSAASLASVLVDRKGTSVVPLARSQALFDALGRAIEEDTLMPDGRFSARTTSYDALGRKTAVSEPGSPGSLTQYLNYDPFGRPGTIRPPDSTAANGFAHDVTMSYGGVQTVTRTVRFGTGWTGSAVTESPSTTTETYDRFGRLAGVSEPSGSGGANVTTSYGYDSGGRLISVTTASSGVTQTRTFNYDPRGFLLWESHPEKSANSFGLGHGTDYTGYDSHGHAHRRIEGGNDLSFTFDAAERPRVTYLTGRASSCSPGSSACVKELTYDATAAGKLYQAARYNHITLGGGAHVSKIAYTYFYNGPDGRISQRDLQHTFDGVVDSSKEAFTQSWIYTPLGSVDTETYPGCQSGFTYCANTTGRAVQNVYTNGFLTSVPNYTGAAGLQYYPNGMVSQVSHVNGVTATYANDPNGRARPASITVTSPSSTVLWSSGAYTYDGAGNVTKIGHGHYLYDGVSRLTSPAVETNAVDAGAGNSLANQTTAYDAFGNIQAFSNRSTPTNSATNHLTGGSYGVSGNLTFWNGATYEYDEIGQLKHYVNGAQEWLYMYDADDERVWSFEPAVGATPRFDRWTLRGLDGKVKRDFEVSGYQWSNWTSGNLWEDYIYRGGLLLAGYLSTGPRRHMDVDHLGTVRLLTNSAGGQTSYHAFLPYGEEATAFNQDLSE
jgi:YD repeat-containing protein